MEDAFKDILMEHEQFKSLLGDVAARFGFERAYGGWFMESPETIIVLDLQKSNYGDYYYLNIKIYVQGLFGKKYKRGKELVRSEVGNVFMRPPTTYDDVFNMETVIDLRDRVKGLHHLFSEYIQPIATLASTRGGIFELDTNGQLHLLPAVREELVKLGK